MDINTKSVNKKLALITISAGLLFLACRTTEDEMITENNEELEDTLYLSRPKIILEAPISELPYNLNWEANPSARSHEIQSSVDIQFSDKRLSWTTRNDSFLLEELPEGESYIRIRSHFDKESSRWSEVLKIERQGNDLTLERLRS